MMEDDSKSIASTSTEFSTGSSVGSNTPSLVGENLESFCLGETEKGAPEGKLYTTEQNIRYKFANLLVVWAGGNLIYLLFP